ncbi:MAG: polyphenol oxidase family protein, partial [Pseudomonadota bacterium]
VGGVLEATISEMVNAGASQTHIHAAVGPAISQRAYEVGPEFEANLLARDPSNARFFRAFEPSGRAHFDLPGYVVHRLSRTGIAEIETVSVCTDANDSAYFSYRRSKRLSEPDYGRQISAIVVA